ncbi:hypothetical protein KCU86_g5115, partial [Aureobasidium melanogenum]
MRVLALGLSRSGTDSLRQALYILGMQNVWHGFNLINPSYPASNAKAFTRLARRKFNTSNNDKTPISRADFEVILAGCDAVTDTPAAVFAPELIAAYPEAKVILNVRDVDAWHKSMVSTLSTLPSNINYGWLIHFHHRLYWTARSFYETTYYALFDGNIEKNGKAAYQKHSEEVREVTQPERFLEWRVEDGWGPLCEFLGVEVPDQDFPHGNNGEEFHRRVEHFKSGYRHKAYENIFGLTGAVFAVAAFTYSWYARMKR